MDPFGACIGKGLRHIGRKAAVDRHLVEFSLLQPHHLALVQIYGRYDNHAMSPSNSFTHQLLKRVEYFRIYTWPSEAFIL